MKRGLLGLTMFVHFGTSGGLDHSNDLSDSLFKLAQETTQATTNFIASAIQDICTSPSAHTQHRRVHKFLRTLARNNTINRAPTIPDLFKDSFLSPEVKLTLTEYIKDAYWPQQAIQENRLGFWAILFILDRAVDYQGNALIQDICNLLTRTAYSTHNPKIKQAAITTLETIILSHAEVLNGCTVSGCICHMHTMLEALNSLGWICQKLYFNNYQKNLTRLRAAGSTAYCGLGYAILRDLLLSPKKENIHLWYKWIGNCPIEEKYPYIKIIKKAPEI